MRNWANHAARAARIGAVAGVLAVSGPVSALADSLGSALANAYNHSGLLEQNRALLRAADEDVAVAMAALRPVVNWSAEMTRTFGRTYVNGTSAGFAETILEVGLSASLTLYDFGRNKLAIEAAKEAVLATRQTLIGIEQQVLFDGVSAYMELRRAIETVGLRQSNLRLITQELRAAEDRFEVGEVTRTDVALAEARLASARGALAAAQGQLDIARADYASAIGRKPGATPTPARLPRLLSEHDAIATALRIHPNMKGIQHQIAEAELNVARAKAAVKPTVDATARYGLREDLGADNFRRSGSVSIGISGPVYSGGRLPALARQASARRDALRGQLHVTRHQIRQNVENAYARLSIARAQIVASERQVRAATVAFRGVREEATLGARTTLDVLNAEQELLDARTALVSARVDEMIQAYGALAATGLLTVKHLGLPVQQYDPTEYYNLVKNAPASQSRQGKQLERVLKSLGYE